MKKLSFLLVCFLLNQTQSFAETESMSQMPILKPKKIHTLTSKEQGETLQEQSGFGDQASETRMMNLMMVGGSGYEGMDMEEMKTIPATSSHVHASTHTGTPSFEIILETKLDSIKKGSQIFDFQIQEVKTKKLISGLKPKASVFMTNMDMGTEFPKVTEIKAGHYRVKAPFSMQGPWALKIEAKETVKVFEINVQNK